MTKQEYLWLLIRSASDGTFPSQGDGPFQACRYRGKGKKRCAVGLLIPDEKYHQELEGNTTRDACVQSAITIPDGLTVDNLSDIQNGHDRLASTWDTFRFVDGLRKLDCFQDCSFDLPESASVG